MSKGFENLRRANTETFLLHASKCGSVWQTEATPPKTRSREISRAARLLSDWSRGCSEHPAGTTLPSLSLLHSHQLLQPMAEWGSAPASALNAHYSSRADFIDPTHEQNPRNADIYILMMQTSRVHCYLDWCSWMGRPSTTGQHGPAPAAHSSRNSHLTAHWASTWLRFQPVAQLCLRIF